MHDIGGIEPGAIASAAVAEGQVERAGLLQVYSIPQPDHGAELVAHRDVVRRKVNARDAAAKSAGHEPRRATDAAADIEHAQPCRSAQRLADKAAGLAAADVELVDGTERAGIGAVGVEPGGGQAGADRTEQVLPGVVGFDPGFVDGGHDLCSCVVYSAD